MKIKLIVFLISSLLISTISSGAESFIIQKPDLPTSPLTLIEVTDFALRHNPTSSRVWAQIQIADAKLGIAKSSYLPQINAGGVVQYAGETVYGPNISLSYLLWDFGYRSNSVLASRYALMASHLDRDSAIQQIILQVQTAYYSVLGEQALLAANQKNVLEAKTNLEAAKALHQQGLATIGDVYQAESSLAQSSLNLQKSRGNYQIAVGQLATAMGLPTSTPLQLAPLAEPTHVIQTDKEVALYLNAAKRQRPDLVAAETLVQARQSQLAATKASGWPTLEINANVTPSFTGNMQSVSNTASATLSLSFPLFTGFSQTNKVKQAQAEIVVAEATRDQLDQQVQYQVWQAYFTLKTAVENLASIEVLLKSSAQAHQQAVGQYKGGVGNILTVLTTQSALANARVQSIQAKINWYMALAQLATAIGTLNTSSSEIPL